MMRTISRLLLLLSFAATASAQVSIYVYPVTKSVPPGTHQTVTAIVTGSQDRTVTWSKDCGTIEGTNPSTNSEPSTVSLYNTASSTTCHITAMSNADVTKTATSTVTFTTAPTPVSGHPRFLTTSSDLSAKATAGNTMYQALRTVAVNAYNSDNAVWSWSCNSGTGQPSSDQSLSYREQNAPYYALMSIANGSDPTYKWGCYGRDIATYFEIRFLADVNNYPGNHWSDPGRDWPFPPDWLMSHSTYLNRGSGATATATLTSGTMNTPTVTAGGTGYLPGAVIYWAATAGSSGCTIANGSLARMVAWGTVPVNGSGVVSGTMTTVMNATGCTTAPTIQILDDHQLFHLFLAGLAQYSTTNNYGTNATPSGSASVYNSSSQFQQGSIFDMAGQRAMGNNYSQTKMLDLAVAGLTFDDNTTDDPPLDNSCGATRYQVCSDGTAGSSRAYWVYFTGGMLYKAWANFEDPSVTWPVYQSVYGNLPSEPTCNSTFGSFLPCFGLGRGGESSEGTDYGAQAMKTRNALNAVATAGYLNPLSCLQADGTTKACPQLSLASSSYWDLRTITDLSWLTGIMNISGGGQIGSWTYVPTGDEAHFAKYPSQYITEAAGLLWNAISGDTDNNAAMLWLVVNSAYGGATGSQWTCSGSCGFTSAMGNDWGRDVVIDMFLSQPAGDPVTSLPADPRPSLPTEYYAIGNKHLFLRDNWTGGTLINLYAPDTLIDHEHQFDMRYGVYVDCGDPTHKCEPVTRGRTEFDDYNNLMTTSINQNVVSYINNPGGTCNDPNTCSSYYSAQYGGQWAHAEQQGLVPLKHVETPAYVSWAADTTNAYNSTSHEAFPTYSGNIPATSRSIVVLRAQNTILTYDRGNSGANAWSKASYLNATGTPTCTGSTCTWPTQSGAYKGVWTSLLPSGVNPTVDVTYTPSNDPYTPGGGDLCDGAHGNGYCDPYIKARLKVDGGTAASNQFLSSLQWGVSSFTPATTTLVQSSAGQTFDGAKVGTAIAMFMRTAGSFTGTTYPASGATSQYVSDLLPNTTYGVTASGAPTSATTDASGLLNFAADGTGFVSIGAASALAPTFSPGSGTFTSIQTVTISSASPGVVICWSSTNNAPATDGSTGCSVGTRYTGPVSVASSEILYAVAGGTGFADSSVNSAEYTINIPKGVVQGSGVTLGAGAVLGN